jgi:hypothetical protein
MTTLTAATDQWMSRPADERFGSLADLHAAVTHHREASIESTHVDIKSLVASSQDGEPIITGTSGVPARFTNYGFGQFTRRIGAPAAYLRELPAELVALNMNHGIATCENGDDDNLLFASNGSLRLRAALSGKYTRIWNSDVTSRLIRLTDQSPEWQPAPAAFDGSRGLYASDENMFAFLVDNDRRIFEKGPGGGLGRGFFVSNSEVGSASFAVTTFFYEYICGNHRVWGASGISELRIPHIGTADARAFDRLSVELTRYADSSAADDELKVAAMMRTTLGGTKDEVLDRVFSLRLPGLGRKVALDAYTLAEAHSEWYGDPKSVWGLTGGATELARDMANADDRVALERSAGKLMQIAF